MIAVLRSLIFLGQLVGGQIQAPATRPKTDPYTRVAIEINPVAPPVPALQYLLIPEYSQQTGGNAAMQYMIAIGKMPAGVDYEALDELRNSAKLDQVKASEMVARFAACFQQAEIASRMEKCDWGLPVRDLGPGIQLPFLSSLRSMSRALALRIRLEIAQGKLDAAIADLRLGFTMSWHTSQQGVLIQGLVAAGLDSYFFASLLELQQAPGAPNLYWALANLPRPLVEHRSIIEMERSLFYAAFPELRGRRIEQLDDHDFSVMFSRMANLREGNPTPQKKAMNSVDQAFSMVSIYERAKRRLIEQGQTALQVEQMPVRTVVGSYLLGNYLKWADELDKWSGLPYWQAREGMARCTQAMLEQEDLRGNPLMQLIPAVDRAVINLARVQRVEVEAQCIEALRAYAASHQGALPATLDELIDTPVPLDPITGKPMGYEARGNTATLTTTPISGERNLTGRIIQITVK